MIVTVYACSILSLVSGVTTYPAPEQAIECF